MKFKREFSIGLLAIICISVSIWGYKFLLGKDILNPSNTFYVKYATVDQLRPSNPVFVKGFQVGTVQNIQLTENHDSVLVTLDITRDVTIPKQTVATIFNNGAIGPKAILLELAGECCAQSGDFLKGKIHGMLQSLVPPEELDLYLNKIKSGVSGVLDTIQNTIDNPQAKSLKDLHETISNLASLTRNLDRLLAQSSANLNASFQNLASISKNLKDNNDKITHILANVEIMTEDFKQAELGKDIKSTVTNLNTTMTDLKSILTQANSTFKDVNHLLDGIQKGQGTLGALTTDKKLYENLQSTSRNLDLILQDLRLNPKRYISVSVFGKKQKEYTLPLDDPASGSPDSLDH